MLSKPIKLLRFLKLILLLIIFLTPLVGSLGGYGFEESKVIFFFLATTIASLLFIYLILIRSIVVVWSGIKTILGLFMLVLLLTSVFGIDWHNSLFGQPPYFQGFILYFYLYIFFILTSSVKLSLGLWAGVLSSSGFIIALLIIRDWSIINILKLHILNYAGRPIATFGQPNLAAGFILLGLPFLISSRPTSGRWRKIIYYLVIGVCMGAIILTFSRAAIFLLLFLVLFYLAFKITKSKLVISLEILILFLLFLYTSYNFSTGLLDKELKQPKNISWLINNSPEKRVFIWPAIWQSISQRPILGYGLENIPQAFPKYLPHERRPPHFYKLKDLVIDRSHNYVLDLLVFSGSVGLMIWLMLIMFLLREAKSKILLVGLLIYLVWTALQIQSIVHLMYFYLLVGLIDKDT